MNKWFARFAWLVGGLLAFAVAGWIMGRPLHAPVIAVLFSAAFGLAVILFSDAWRGTQLTQWLRSDADGPPPMRAGVWGEIAAQIERALKRRERSIRFEQQRLTDFLAAVEASPIGVLLLDANEQISWCSHAGADHLGLQPQRDLRQHVTNLVRSPAFVEQLAAPPSDKPVNFASPTGISVSCLVRHYGDGLKLVLTQDVTGRERAEAMRRQFVADVSHEIRTPLTVLSGFVETMNELPLAEGDRKRVLALMATQTQRMQTLVADLLTLAQLEGSPRASADQLVSVAALLERVRADAERLSAGNHRLSFSGGEDAQIAGSEHELFSAVSNLVVNAVRYTPSGGSVHVDWRWLDDGGGALVVRDSGIGIAREHWSRLTERFYRVDGSRSRDTGGTGLGLSIVKHVAQRHGGGIDLHSAPGKGSTFTLSLPAARVRRIVGNGLEQAAAAAVER